MTGDRGPIPVTADDVGEDFDATASPPPGAQRRSLVAAEQDYDDPGHLMEPEEWAAVVARAEGQS